MIFRGSKQTQKERGTSSLEETRKEERNRFGSDKRGRGRNPGGKGQAEGRSKLTGENKIGKKIGGHSSPEQGDKRKKPKAGSVMCTKRGEGGV